VPLAVAASTPTARLEYSGPPGRALGGARPSLECGLGAPMCVRVCVCERESVCVCV